MFRFVTAARKIILTTLIRKPERPMPNMSLLVRPALGPATPYKVACNTAYEQPKSTEIPSVQ
jgi:hypothetical protein